MKLRTLLIILAGWLILIIILIYPTNLDAMPYQSITPSPNPKADVFFNGFTNACVLPCWSGLEVGVSTEEELLKVLSSFRFGEISQPRRGDEYEYWYIDKRIDSLPNNQFDAEVKIGSFAKNDILQGLEFRWNDTLVTTMTVHRILEAFGTPSAILIGMSGANIYARVSIWLEYDAYRTYFVYDTAILAGDEDPYEICFDLSQWISNNHDPLVSIFVLAPELFGWDKTIRTTMGIYFINYLDEATTLTPETFTRLILNEETSCIQFDADVLAREFEVR